MTLKKYKEKRNFDKTNEPDGKSKDKFNKAIFVIQYHQARTKHYDFRMQHNGVLLSWAVPKGLSQDPRQKRLAVMVEDHPVEYADFEGIIPKGNYGAGSVEIYDKGVYLPLGDFNAGLKKGHLKFVLNGNKHKGQWSLIKTDSKNWIIVKTNDQFSEKENQKARPVKNPFTSCPLQLATLSKSVPKEKNWLYEIKYDGYRILCFAENKKIKLMTRNNIDYTKKFDLITKSLKKINQQCFVVDGEIVVFDQNGRSDFGLLQKALKNNPNQCVFVIFDLLSLNGVDLRNTPLSERKKKLEILLAKADSNLLYSSHIKSKGKQCFEFAKNNNLEGIVAKKQDSKYRGGRNDDWLKIKCYNRQDFVIGGYTTSDKNEQLSSILVGYYDNDKLIFVGKVGTGFNDIQRKDLAQVFDKIKTKMPTFSNLVKENNVHFVKPILVAEIQYAELTKDNFLRQPSFIGLRSDKPANKVKLEV